MSSMYKHYKKNHKYEYKQENVIIDKVVIIWVNL